MITPSHPLPLVPMTDPIPPADPQAVLRLAGVDLVRGDRLLLDQVSVTVQAGEHWALLGPNGSGKSTLLRIMATYAHPTRGQVHILGHRLGRVNVFALRPWIGQVSPDHPVAPARTVRQVVFTGVTGTIQLVPRRETTAAELARAGELTELLGLRDRADAPWHVLSQGERGRTLIARALMARVAALACDLGSPIVELTVRADNPAQNFYLRTGFQPVPHCLTYVLAGPALKTLADQDQKALALAG